MPSVFHNFELYLCLLIVMLNASANVMIKKGALSKQNIYLNGYTLLGYGLFFLVMLFTIKVIAMIELKYFSLLLACNYIMTYLVGITVFDEFNGRLGLLGIVLVGAGLVIFNF